MNAILNNLIYFEDYLPVELKGSSSQCLTNVVVLISLQLNIILIIGHIFWSILGGNQLQTDLYEKVV